MTTALEEINFESVFSREKNNLIVFEEIANAVERSLNVLDKTINILSNIVEKILDANRDLIFIIKIFVKSRTAINA
ncbi:hypothetical protein AYI68_g4695 [Smittium mucronatum]|uniref:Uncharacterized protein n=1 Tax=Smittium mucronatum TaxID=133383 RepID=A0A1R0GWC6_9FUNG|nr:hypothetical protein AYI68_g4695 [Smittium mucronatum]